MIRGLATHAILLALTIVAAAETYNEVAEETTPLRLKIEGKTVRVEALVVKPVPSTGRLPIALIAHGKPETQGRMRDQHAEGYALHARDLARRGWLAGVVMRRGFGNSDGPAPVLLSCGSPLVQKQLDSNADDLEATLMALAQRPDADASRMLVLGVSAGCCGARTGGAQSIRARGGGQCLRWTGATQLPSRRFAGLDDSRIWSGDPRT
jgi:hypothetical protein